MYLICVFIRFISCLQGKVKYWFLLMPLSGGDLSLGQMLGILHINPHSAKYKITADDILFLCFFLSNFIFPRE